jgi:hypothetical protein
LKSLGGKKKKKRGGTENLKKIEKLKNGEGWNEEGGSEQGNKTK